MADDGPPRILFLDDDPRRAADFLMAHPHAVWVRTVPDCLERLAEPWDVVHLDHDLGGEIFVDSGRTDCGMEVVRWLTAENGRDHLKPALFVVHTHNMNAAGGMVTSLREAGYEAIYRPFGIDLLSWLEEEPQAAEVPPSPGPSLCVRWLEWIRRVLGRRGRRDSTVSSAPKPPDSG